MHVSNGPDVDGSLTDVIAFSSDGTNWDFIEKASISTVTGWFQADGTYQDTGYKYDNKTILRIERKDDHAPLTFELQDVENQATWTGGAEANLQVAKVDIAGWL